MTKSVSTRLETTILSNLIYNEDYARKVIPFIKEEYFQDGIEKVIFKSIWKYAENYKSAATVAALAIEVQKATLNEEQYNTAIEYLQNIPLTFRYEVLYNKEGVVDEDNVDEFRDLIGDILLTIIEEGLEHDQVRINTVGNDNT